MQAKPQNSATPNGTSRPDGMRKAQFAIVPMWVHRRIIATRTRTMALSVYIELVGQYAGSARDAEGLRVWPEVQQIADSMEVPKSSVERALKVLIDCGVVLKKRTVRRNQYWLPQEDPEAFTQTLAEFQSVTSDGPHPQSVTSDVLDSIQSVTSDGPQTVTSDGPQTVTSDGLCNPDPSIQTQETSLSSVVATAEDARARGAVTERETMASPTDKPTTALPSQRAAQQPQTAVSAPQQAAADRQPQEAPQTPQTAATAPQDAAHDDVRIAEAWITSRQAHGHGVPARARTRMIRDAEKLLAEGEDAEHLIAAAADMGKQATWFDLARHLEKFVPQSKAPLPSQGPGLPEWCEQCGEDYGSAARNNPRFRLIDDAPCPDCHPSAVSSALRG